MCCVSFRIWPASEQPVSQTCAVTERARRLSHRTVKSSIDLLAFIRSESRGAMPPRRVPPLLPWPQEMREDMVSVSNIPPDKNLAMFLQYHYRRPHYACRWSDLPLECHVSGVGQISTDNVVPLNHPTPFLVNTAGDLVSMKLTRCVRTNCPRCQQHSGGYTFQWNGVWTCQNVVRANAAKQADAHAIWRECLNGSAPCENCILMRGICSPRYTVLEDPQSQACPS